MKNLKDDRFSLTRRFLVFRRDNILMLNAMAAFAFAEPDRPLSEDAVWENLALCGGGNIFDEGFHKTRAEFIVHGACHAPGGQPVRQCPVRVRVGETEKTLLVFGDRYWLDRDGRPKPSEPAPFTRMALGWGQAFGGPGHKYNPGGKGLAEVVFPEGQRLLPLPNVEDPKTLLTSPQENPVPAGLGMLGSMRFWRGEGLGTYDERWLAEYWPFLPPDADIDLANTAPSDQWLPGYFCGGEPVEITNMHPEQPVLHTRLPQVRIRFFMRQLLRDRVQRLELPCDFDTVWLLPERGLMVCAWRAVTLCTSHGATDISHVLVACEDPETEPRPKEEYFLRFGESAAPLAPPPTTQPQREATPPRESAPPREPAPPPPGEPVVSRPAPPPQGLLPEPDLKALQRELQATCQRLGIEPRPTVAAADPFGLEGLPPGEAMQRLDGILAEHQQALERSCASLGIDPTAWQPPAPPDLRELAAQLGALDIADPKLKAAAETLREMLLELPPEPKTDAQPAAPEPQAEAGLPEPPPGRLDREQVLHWLATGRSLAGQDLTGLDLSACKLAGGDFRRACLEGAVLRDADLGGCDCSQALLTGADLTGAKAEQARFIDAQAAGLKAVGARFTGADLSGAHLVGADLTRAELTQARLVRTDLESATLQGAVLQGCQGTRLDCQGADLRGAVLAHAELTGARFEAAHLDNTDFRAANLRGASFSDAQGVKPVFAGADLSESKASGGAVLLEADFSGARLTGARWTDCDLGKAVFVKANLDHAELRGSRFADASFRLASAKHAALDRADLTRANLQGLNAFKASLREATLVCADLCNANCYAVDFFKASFHETRLADTVLARTLLGKWRPLRF